MLVLARCRVMSTAVEARPSPVGRLGEPGDDVDERGLAGAVGADQEAQLALVDGEVDAVEGAEPVEVDATGPRSRARARHRHRSWPSPSAELDGAAGRPSRRRRRRRRRARRSPSATSPAMPPGTNADDDDEQQRPGSRASRRGGLADAGPGPVDEQRAERPRPRACPGRRPRPSTPSGSTAGRRTGSGRRCR